MNRVGIFLDRDGTIIEERDYLSQPSQIRFLEGSVNAIKNFNELGLKVFIVTNQSAVARKIIKEEDLIKIHQAIIDRINEDGGKIDDIYYCPHHPDFGSDTYRKECSCRKPKTGMLEKAAAEHGIDLARSFVIGDKMIDIQTGINCGARAVLVLTGYGNEELQLCRANNVRIDFIASNLSDASSFIRKYLTEEQSSNVQTKFS